MTTGRLADLDPAAVACSLRRGSLVLQTGLLSVRLRSRLPSVHHYLAHAYAQHPVALGHPFADFSVEVRTPANLRRWLKPQAQFYVDGQAPFEPLSLDQAPALMEWGMNWTIAASCHQWLMLHAACLERDGRAVVLPAPPGSGKSTLCAALALRGWRLLSDEMCLIDPERLQIVALARPINLKNASIDVIRAFDPDARWGPLTFDTVKGRVTHLCPPAESVVRMQEPAHPRWIVFPQWVSGAEPELTPKSRRETFIELARNAFNYGTLGLLGFETMGRLVKACDPYAFRYDRLQDALEVFDWIAGTATQGQLSAGPAARVPA